MVDAAALATAFGVPEMDVNETASYTEANADATPPTQATAAGAYTAGTAGQVPPDSGLPINDQAAGFPGAAGAAVTARSLWQTWSLGIRMVAPTSWQTLRPNAVVALNTLSWG